HLRVFERELKARGRGVRVDHAADVVAQLRLRLFDLLPDLPLRFGAARRELQILRRRAVGRGRELRRGFRAALRPATVLDAEGGDGDAPRMRGHDQIDGEHTILLAALDDVARLDEDLVVGDVLDGEFVDVPRLVNDD